jgi:hypothetical protein
MSIDAAEIRRRLTNVLPGSPEVGEALDQITSTLIEAGTALAAIVPPGREQSLMVTHLEEVSFWAKKGVALAQEG